MKRLVLLFFGLGLVAAVAPAGAHGPSLVCGAVVMQDVTLRSSLRGCETGLVVGADGVTINLNGHSIEGVDPASGAGIEASDRSGVTVKDGRISGFATGVRLVNATNSTIKRLRIRDTGQGIFISNFTGGGFTSNEVAGNVVTNSANGITVFGSVGRVARNMLLEISGDGLFCRGAFDGPNQLEENVVARAETGFDLLFCPANMLANVAYSNLGNGIAKDRSPGLMERNVASDNGGSGIDSFDSEGLFTRNVTTGNQGSGLLIGDINPLNGPFYTVTRHLAFNNGLFGIFTSLAGIVDGGRNVAQGNGSFPQCFGVVCK